MTSVVYAILDELHQYFVPGRYMSLLDMGVDSLGILVASAIYFVRVRRK
jgi:VanZ family protein